MKIKNVCFLLLISAGFALAACNNSQSKKSETPALGDDKDEHGCITSAGYTWSEVQKDCIRLWEKGVHMMGKDDKLSSIYVVFSPDSLQVELFFADDTPNEILYRRSLPAGGYAWNVEDDDTKNLRLEAGLWTITRRGEYIYREHKKLKEELGDMIDLR